MKQILRREVEYIEEKPRGTGNMKVEHVWGAGERRWSRFYLGREKGEEEQKEMMDKFPGIQLFVQPSEIRCFEDEAYLLSIFLRKALRGDLTVGRYANEEFGAGDSDYLPNRQQINHRDWTYMNLYEIPPMKFTSSEISK